MQPVIEFELVGVPESWANQRIWSRQASIAQHVRMKEWTNAVVAWGMVKRLQANWSRAEEGHLPRNLIITQFRHRELDDDNLYTSIKPLVDGCKTYLRRQKKTVFGAGLIWNDNPKHCHIYTTQTIIPYKDSCHVLIQVERFDIEDSSMGEPQ